MARRSGVQGVGRLRRLLRRLPTDLTSELRETMQAAGGIVLREMLRRVPRDSGSGARELRMRVARDGMSVQIGVIGRRSWKKAFHLLFSEFGTVHVEARPWIWPAFEAVRHRIEPMIKTAVDRTLQKAVRSL